ncbi:MAG: alkaline phosphatase family protein [Halorientalis sp.]
MDLAVVGLDGLSPNMFEHCRDEVPVLDRLLSEGAGGDLRSTTPAVTFPAWTSFMTGKDPGAHGLYNMGEVGADYANNSPSVNETDGALYDAFDDGVFVNVPASYPRQPSGDAKLVPFSAPSVAEAVPPEWRDWPELEDYRLVYDTDRKADADDFLAHLRDIAAARFAVTERAVEEEDPDVLFVLFSCTDWLFHHLDPADSDDYVRDLLVSLEPYLEWVEERADNLVVMSDHGFEHKTTAGYPNKILENQGFVRTETPQDAESLLVTVAGLIRRVTSRSDLAYELVRRTYNRLSHTDVANDLYDAKELDIDFDATTAWHTQRGTVFLNDDRFENPQVGPDEREAIVDAVVEVLDSARHPETGDPLFAEVFTADELYSAERGTRPDVVAEPAEGVILYQTPMQEKIASSTDIYNHRTQGLFTCVGEAFTDADVDAAIPDVAPTLLHAMGRPVPEDMTGEVLTDVVATDRAVESGAPLEPGPVGTREAAAEADLREQLADLGYME